MKKWKALLRTGEKIEENETIKWDDIKDKVVELEFDNNDQTISLPKNAKSYLQGKTASINISSGKCSIESRYIGVTLGNNIVRVRINEKTNNISIETQ